MPSRNEYPARPVPAVDAFVFREGGVLMVKRADEPGKGQWSPPGGSVEVGETVEQAAERETHEETGVAIRPLKVVDVREVIRWDEAGRVRWHYVLLGVLCEYVSGEPFPGSDAENARFLPLQELGEYDVIPDAREALERVMGMRAP